MEFKKILVANRGEIAIRIIRAIHELGKAAVGVYSEADNNSLHLHLCDENICIGKAEPVNSYLKIDQIISAALISGCDAIHPGYGFLSESATFASACRDSGIAFIGPSPENIEIFGDKVEAKKIAKKLGVPIVEGSEKIEDLEEAKKKACQLGYPIITKAPFGGGGRGMRTIHTEEELERLFLIAQEEALRGFGRKSLYIEKYIEKPKHIEVQILADKYRNIIHLGERECSIQRRYQKLLEEAPSFIVHNDKRLRKELTEAAIALAEAVDYENIGTFEFLVDANKNFYFLETNTRIQVEHPVTELITGIDIVKEQILIAEGKKLSYKQEDIKFNGWAIECRINGIIKDAVSKINTLIHPGGFGIRIDSHLYPGYIVPHYYDSLLSKVISHARSRKEAIDKMAQALREYIIDGIETTIPLHMKLLKEEKFLAGDYYVGFLEEIGGG